jgi:hypothetical protein
MNYLMFCLFCFFVCFRCPVYCKILFVFVLACCTVSVMGHMVVELGTLLNSS